MFAIIGLFFIILLSMVLFMLYRNDHMTVKNNRRHAKVEEYWDGKDRRRHARFKKSLDIVYTVFKKPHLRGSARTVDISEGGVKVLLDEKHSIGTIIDLKINLPSSSQDIEAEGRVVWCEEQKDVRESPKRFFYHGIEFTAIKEPSGKHLRDYLGSLLADS
jgi:Tfp pilus assembly protein PilZ